MAVELTGANLKFKYRGPKPKGKNKADYMGNSGRNRGKHVGHPAIHGIRRKQTRRGFGHV